MSECEHPALFIAQMVARCSGVVFGAISRERKQYKSSESAGFSCAFRRTQTQPTRRVHYTTVTCTPKPIEPRNLSRASDRYSFLATSSSCVLYYIYMIIKRIELKLLETNNIFSENIHV